MSCSSSLELVPVFGSRLGSRGLCNIDLMLCLLMWKQLVILTLRAEVSRVETVGVGVEVLILTFCRGYNFILKYV